MVMPETGLAEEPTIPTMRAETGDEEEAEDDDQEGGGDVGEQPDLGSGHGMQGEESDEEDNQQGRAAEDEGHGQVVGGADGS